MSDLPTLVSSFGNYAGKVKTAIEAGDLENLTNLEKLIEDLGTQLTEETSELGSPETGEQRVAVTERLVKLGASNELDCWQGNHFEKTITGATQFTTIRVPGNDKVYTMVLYLTNAGAHQVDFMPNVYWNEGTKPELSAAGRDSIAFSTRDGGVTWDGYLLGKAMALAV